MSIEVYPLFPSLVFRKHCDGYENIKTNLINLLNELRRKHFYTENRSNVGGLQSGDIKDLEEFKFFIDFLESHINQIFSHIAIPLKWRYELDNVWVNINGENSYNITHTHPCSHLSGVFWVQTNEEDGDFNFWNPNQHAGYPMFNAIKEDIREQLHDNETITMKHKEGMLQLFPSHLPHYVNINKTKTDRISISFNLILSPIT